MDVWGGDGGTKEEVRDAEYIFIFKTQDEVPIRLNVFPLLFSGGGVLVALGSSLSRSSNGRVTVVDVELYLEDHFSLLPGVTPLLSFAISVLLCRYVLVGCCPTQHTTTTKDSCSGGDDEEVLASGRPEVDSYLELNIDGGFEEFQEAFTPWRLHFF